MGRPQRADQRGRDLRKELATLRSEPPGADRARRLAEFTRIAHGERLLNLAMQAGALCLDDDPDAPSALVAAYAPEPSDDPDVDDAATDPTARGGTADGGPRDDEERLALLADLGDLARYLDRPDLGARAASLAAERAHAWVVAAEPSERRYRLRTVESLTSREVADTIRDALDASA